MDEEALVEDLRQFAGADISPVMLDSPEEEYVEGGVKLWPVQIGTRLLELEANYSVIPPAIEIVTYGMTLQLDTPELGRLQARSMGWNKGSTLRVVASLGAAKMPKGRHKAVFALMAYVKISPTVVKGFLNTGSFDFEIQ
jgi:hypothetical protein